jgi:hypothetical protein
VTDARMPDRWLYQPEYDGLSDRAWRTMTSSLMWSAGQGTDGVLPVTSLRFLHPLGVDEATAQELIDAGKWEKTGNGFQVLNWQKSQSLAADVEKQRDRNRENVKAYRARKGESPHDEDDYVIDVETGEVIGDNSGDVHGVPVGKARTGKDALRGSELKLAGSSKRATKIAVEPDDASLVRSCSACQAGFAFKSGPCPQHRSETA